MDSTQPSLHRRRIVIAGGSGFIGTGLTRLLVARGDEVVILSRSTRPQSASYTGPGMVRYLAWDGRSAGQWAQELDGADGLVNLAGQTINGRPTPAYVEQVIGSRVAAAQALGAACRRCHRPPAVWVQAAAVALYGDTGDEWLDEDSPTGTGHAVETCVRWEEAYRNALTPATRGVITRIGIVLGRDGGALPTLSRLVRWGLGGSAGNGRQWVPWIHEADMQALVLRALDDPTFSGAYNACTPNPVTNAELMRQLRKVLRRPWSPPAPAIAVRVGAWFLGTDPRLVLTGRRVRSSRLAAAGFPFRYAQLESALGDLLGKPDRSA